MSDAIKAALALLDHKNDAHWTQAGAPMVDVVEALVEEATPEGEEPAEVSRDLITETDPELTRAVAKERAGEVPNDGGGSDNPETGAPGSGGDSDEQNDDDKASTIAKEKAAAQAKVAEATKVLNAARVAHNEATVELDAVLKKEQIAADQVTQSERNRLYIETSRKRRREEVERRKKAAAG